MDEICSNIKDSLFYIKHINTYSNIFLANGIGKAGLGKDTLEVSIDFIRGWFVLLFCFALCPTGKGKHEFMRKNNYFQVR